MATLLPLAEQQFCDGDGAPLAGGKVFFYAPNTTTKKDTWSDAGQTALNTNPVILDAAGRAVIFGEGSYRQVLKDKDDNLVWDSITAATDSAQASWAGTATGTANNITLTAINFASVDGQAIDFLAGATNTDAAQVTVNGVAIPLRLDTLSGPVQTPAGCIVLGDRYRVVYDATAGLFHLSPLVDKGYVDAGDAATLASAYSGILAGVSAAEAFATNGDAATLASANSYAVGQANAAFTAANGHSDANDAATLASAKQYTDTSSASTLSSAQAYANSVQAYAISTSKSYSDGKLAAAQSANASTYVQGVRLSGRYTATFQTRQAGSVVVAAGSSTASDYAFLQANIGGTWMTVADA